MSEYFPGDFVRASRRIEHGLTLVLEHTTGSVIGKWKGFQRPTEYQVLFDDAPRGRIVIVSGDEIEADPARVNVAGAPAEGCAE